MAGILLLNGFVAVVAAGAAYQGFLAEEADRHRRRREMDRAFLRCMEDRKRKAFIKRVRWEAGLCGN